MSTLDSPTALRIIKVLYYVAQCSVLLPVAVGIWRRQWLSPPLRAIFYCCLMWMTLMAFAEYAGKVWHYNVAVYDAVEVFEMWFVGLAYYRVLHFRFRRHFLLVGILYTAFALLDTFVLHGLWKPTTYTTVLRSFLSISLVLLYFEQILRELRNTRLEKDPMFVASVALLLYDACSVFVFIVRNTQSDGTKFIQVLSINSVLSIFQYILLARAFWLAGRAQKAALEPTPMRASQQLG